MQKKTFFASLNLMRDRLTVGNKKLNHVIKDRILSPKNSAGLFLCFLNLFSKSVVMPV